jgi:N6-adenosine-specific RNA methylase IME4
MRMIMMNDFPDKKYKLMYLDLPLTYDDKALAGNRGAGCKYDLMTDEELLNMPVGSIADKDCIMFLWATFPKLQLCLDCIKSWGFEYKTVAFVWVKKNGNGTNFMGMGRWTRANAEIVLLATKGSPKRIDAGINQIIETIPKEHSKKPDIVRQQILRLVGDIQPRIEFFPRTLIHGWDTFGNDEKLKLEPLESYF